MAVRGPASSKAIELKMQGFDVATAACWSAVLTGTKRIVGRETASQIASASAASRLLRLMYAFTYCAGISRTSWPSARNSRPQ